MSTTPTTDSLFEKDKEIHDFLKNKIFDDNITKEEHLSLKVLELRQSQHNQLPQ